MKRAIAVMLAVLLAMPGCAARVPATHQPSSGPTRTPLRISPLALRRAAMPRALVPQDAAAWEKYVAGLPVGSRVKVETRDGRRFKATFIGVERAAVLLKPRTRIPEPVRSIPIASLVSLEIDQGMSPAKIVGIAAGVAGATVLTFFLVLLATID